MEKRNLQIHWWAEDREHLSSQINWPNLDSVNDLTPNLPYQRLQNPIDSNITYIVELGNAIKTKSSLN